MKKNSFGYYYALLFGSNSVLVSLFNLSLSLWSPH